MKVILLTGASSGIGYETATLLAKQGHKVYGAARRVDNIKKLEPFGVVPIKLDVTDNNSIEDAVNLIVEREGKIDVVINNAGYGYFGAIEDVSLEEARKQFDVNLFGLANVTKKVLPYMRAQKKGLIINTSSMGAKFTSYFGAWYHATKYAVESFSDALRMEVKDFGINVVLIEPGAIKTDWGFIAADNLERSARGGAYEKRAVDKANRLRRQYSSKVLTDPKVIAKTIVRAVNAKNPKVHYLVGYGAKPLLILRRVLPMKIFDKVVRKYI